MDEGRSGHDYLSLLYPCPVVSRRRVKSQHFVGTARLVVRTHVNRFPIQLVGASLLLVVVYGLALLSQNYLDAQLQQSLLWRTRGWRRQRLAGFLLLQVGILIVPAMLLAVALALAATWLLLSNEMRRVLARPSPISVIRPRHEDWDRVPYGVGAGRPDIYRALPDRHPKTSARGRVHPRVAGLHAGLLPCAFGLWRWMAPSKSFATPLDEIDELRNELELVEGQVLNLFSGDDLERVRLPRSLRLLGSVAW